MRARRGRRESIEEEGEGEGEGDPTSFTTRVAKYLLNPSLSPPLIYHHLNGISYEGCSDGDCDDDLLPDGGSCEC